MYLWIWNLVTDELMSGYSYRGKTAPEGCTFLLASSREKAERERERAKAAGVGA